MFQATGAAQATPSHVGDPTQQVHWEKGSFLLPLPPVECHWKLGRGITEPTSVLPASLPQEAKGGSSSSSSVQRSKVGCPGVVGGCGTGWVLAKPG